MLPDRVTYVVPYGDTDASVRERGFAWARRLQATGVETRIQLGSSVRFQSSGVGAHDGDTVVVLRHAIAWGQGFPERRILRSANFGIYELDDGLPVDNGRLPELGRWWKPIVAKSRLADRAARSADRVIAGNERLAEWASGRCRDVRVVPTCIEPTQYVVKRDFDRSGPLRMVWIGSRATEVHLLAIADVLDEFHRVTGATLTMIGDPSCPVPTTIARFTKKVAWSPTVHHDLGAFGEVGLMPLPDRPYEQHKCAYKLLQYAAAGLPMIGSPVGASIDALHRFGALAPSTFPEWLHALHTHSSMAAADQAKLGAQACHAVAASYSFERWQGEYELAISPP